MSTKSYITIGDKYPGFKYVEEKITYFYTPAAGAADASKAWPVFCNERACRVKEVSIVPQAAVTGQATNTFNLNLINKGTDGAGTTELANRDYVAGVNEVAFDERVLYTPTTPLSLAAGSVLALQRELVGTGLATPELLVKVVYVDDLSDFDAQING